MKEYIFYGAVDLNTSIIWRAMQYVEDTGGSVICFVDDNPARQKDDRYPRPVYGRAILKKYPDAVIVILSSAVREICTALKKNGIENKVVAYPLFRWWFPCADIKEVNLFINDWTKENTGRLVNLYAADDDETKRILQRILEQRKMAEFTFVDAESMFGFHYKDYFFDTLLQPKDETITLADCGAYQGDSLYRLYNLFGDKVKKGYAIEPDADNMRLLKDRLADALSDKDIECIEAGVADEEAVYRFESNAMSGRLSDTGDIEVKVCRLDDVIHEVYGKLCITMDVEGYEAAAIKGAEKIIQKYRPYIIACLYHKPEDILDVPNVIREICPDYDFYLRAGTHTECYAIPSS